MHIFSFLKAGIRVGLTFCIIKFQTQKHEGTKKGMQRLSGLGLRPSGFDPTRRVQRSGLQKIQTAHIKGFVDHIYLNY